MKYRNVGVLGGMFDPVHHGHLRTALEVLESLPLDQMRLVPCGTPAHRAPTRASCARRIDMLRLATRGEPRFVVDTRECEREGVSYMVDTLSSLKREEPERRLFLLLGTDAFNGLPGWKRWRELFELAHLVVLARPGWELQAGEPLSGEYEARRVRGAEALMQREAGAVLCYELTPLMISSSHIREVISSGKSARYLLPEQVCDYIDDHRLYV